MKVKKEWEAAFASSCLLANKIISSGQWLFVRNYIKNGLSMKFSTKLSFSLLLSGTTVLILLACIIYKMNYNSLIESQLLYSHSIANEISGNVDALLAEKVKTSLTLAHTPDILKALQTSNMVYANMAEEKREQTISSLNAKWKATTDPADDFILEYTDNRVSQLLKQQQKLLQGEYGEIFITNKFGALLASTAKLTTLAHGQKYWWRGAYRNGEGAIFFDDRGYDDSVGGYVLGLVVPVRDGKEIIGILKCNLNILGSIDKLISSAEDKLFGVFKLARSGGMVVFEKGAEPLSTRVPGSIQQKTQNGVDSSLILSDGAEKLLVGISEVKLTHGTNGYGFGGTFESTDHQKGNTGESWYILGYRKLSVIQAPAVKLIQTILLTGLLLIILLALLSYVIGKKLSQPLAIINNGTREIGGGNFEYRIDIVTDDELGNLARSFNEMSEQLQNSTTSLALLEESQAYLQSIFLVTPIGIGVVTDRVLQQVNPLICKITGYTEEELLGQNARMLYPNDTEFERVGREKYKQISETGTGTVETRFRCKDGHVIDVLLSSTPIDQQDLSKGVTFTVLDITERKETERKLRQNVLEWSTAMDASDDAIYLLDLNRHLLRANKSFYLMTGSNEQSALGKHIEQIVHPQGEEVPCPVCQAQEDRRNARIVMETDHPDNPTGRPIEITVTIVKGDQGQDLSIFMRLHDLSRQRQVENELRQGKEQWERTFDSFTDIVTLQDTDLSLLKVNKAACVTLDLPCEEIIGHHCYELFHGADEPCSDCPLLETRDSFTPYSREMVHEKLGKTFLVSAAPVFDKLGKLEYIAHVAKDITQLKKMEEHLLISEKMTSIAGLAAGVAHEINTPLSGILQSGQLIRMGLDPAAPVNQEIAAKHNVDLSSVQAYFKEQELDFFMEGITSSAVKAAEIIKGLLEFSRPHAGHFSTHNLNKLIQNTLLLARSDYELRKRYDIINVTINEEYEENMPDIICVGSEIEQVILNLVRNGVQAMAENMNKEHCMHLRTRKTGNIARIEVEDNGPGMDTETQKQVFNPFFTTKEVGDGTGLGLSVSYAIICEKHHGTIRVKSTPGKGTRFIIELPLPQEE